jgi:PAB-dependent poly(A)-specific ribonuclease subunit 2
MQMDPMMMHHGGSPVVPDPSMHSQQLMQWVPRGSTCVAMDAIRALTFDSQVELLWVCDAYGTTRSFQPQLSDSLVWYAYSAFTYHGHLSPCIAAVSTPDVLWTACQTTIRAQRRGGASIHCIKVPTTTQRRIFNIVPDIRTQSILFHGESVGIMQVFYETSCDNIVITPGDPIPYTCMAMTQPYLITGSAAGEVALRDPRTFAPTTRIRSDGRVIDLTLANDETTLTVLSGTTVKLFDTRKPTQAISKVQPQAQLTKLLRLSENQVLGGGPLGVECFRTAPEGLFSEYSLDLTGNGMCTTFTLSQNRESLCVGTDKGIVHALSALETITVDPATQVIHGPFRNTNNAVVPKQAAPVSFSKWNEDRGEDKLCELGFDFGYDGELASDWPAPHHMILAVDGKPPVIPQQLREIAANPIENHYGATRADTFRPNPKDKLNQFIPNPWPFNEVLGTDPTKVAERLILMRKQRKSNRANKSGNLAYSKLDEAQQVCYPYGTHQAFDWKAVNQSKDQLIGLDNSLRESWVNAFLHCIFYLQAPHFVIRKTLMRHVCKKHLCLTCEVAALFSNMTVQQQNFAYQPIMQPTNLLRTMRQIPEFVEQKVFLPASDRDDAVAKCHTMAKVFLELIDSELRKCGQRGGVDCLSSVPADYIASVFGTELQLTMSKQPIAPRFYWDVPASASKVDEGLQHLLKQLERYRGEAVSIRNLPPVLLLLLNPEHGHLRPPPSLKFSRPNEEYNYVLTSNIIHLADDADDPGNFVLHVKLPDNSIRTDAGKMSESWVVMNDYCISAPVPSEDTLETLIPSSVNHSTVVTCYVLDKFRQHRARDERFDLYAAAGGVLMDDWSQRELLPKRDPKLPAPRCSLSFDPIRDLRNVSPTDIVAIDAEYIQLHWGNEVRGDEPEWVLNQRRPFMSLARVSCVLSKEPGHERTIIDDYIATNEAVKDYVTQYSGIREGDLDVRKTPYSLTTLKTAVLKLRCLADKGVRFLGHGLSQDFRVINLAVPKYRIIDTLDLFHRKGHRYLSLRFLAYHLLDERVQDDEHDSIIDARTSLRLYRKYNELVNAGAFEMTMDHLLDIGAETNWYVPDDTSTTPTPQTVPQVQPTHARDDAQSVGASFESGPGQSPATLSEMQSPTAPPTTPPSVPPSAEPSAN